MIRLGFCTCFLGFSYKGVSISFCILSRHFGVFWLIHFLAYKKKEYKRIRGINNSKNFTQKLPIQKPHLHPTQSIKDTKVKGPSTKFNLVLNHKRRTKVLPLFLGWYRYHTYWYRYQPRQTRQYTLGTGTTLTGTSIAVSEWAI